MTEDQRQLRLNQIVEFRNQGLTWQQIGDKCGLSRQAVHNFVKCHMPELLNEKMANDKRITRLQQIVELRNEGLTWQQIGDKFGISDSSVCNFVKRQMPELLTGRVINDDDQIERLNQIVEFRNQGLTWRQIGDKFGLSGQAVCNFVKRHMPELFNGRVINDDQIKRLKQIVEFRNQGLTWQQIGAEFGLSQPAVYDFVKRHMPELLNGRVLNDDQIKRLNQIVGV